MKPPRIAHVRKGVYFRPSVETRRAQYYADQQFFDALGHEGQERMFGETRDHEARRRAKEAERRQTSTIGGQEIPEIGDVFRARVNLTEDEGNRSGADKWGWFVAKTPLDRAYGKFMRHGRCWLSQHETEMLRRYRAGKVWFRIWNLAQGLSYSAELRESVDGGGSSQNAHISRLQAGIDRQRILDHAPRMTRQRFFDLDRVCGLGLEPGEHAKNSGRDAKSVKESVLAGLDVVAEYQPWQRLLSREPVLAIRPAA